MASDITEGETVKAVSSYGGVCFPAHIDRSSYSILSVLGTFPETRPSRRGLVAVCGRKKAFGGKSVPWQYEAFVNSDAHRLSDIPEPQNEFELPECSAEALIDYIKTVK